MGWSLQNAQRGRVNNFGYVAPHDFVASASVIVVIGNSFVEGKMNRYEDTLQGRLPGLLQQAQPVYPFGTSGALMPHYLGLAGLIGQRFKPLWVVVVIIRGDFSQGFETGPGMYAWEPGGQPEVRLNPERSDSLQRRAARALTLPRYVREHLQFDSYRLMHPATVGVSAQPYCLTAELTAAEASIAQQYTSQLAAAAQVSPDHVILVLDSDRGAIYRGESGVQSCHDNDNRALQELATSARLLGAHVVDSAPLFSAYYQRTGKRVDYSPLDSHWNGQAHAIVAAEVARIINAAN
jgi:hypothetical protein